MKKALYIFAVATVFAVGCAAETIPDWWPTAESDSPLDFIPYVDDAGCDASHEAP